MEVVMRLVVFPRTTRALRDRTVAAVHALHDGPIRRGRDRQVEAELEWAFSRVREHLVEAQAQLRTLLGDLTRETAGRRHAGLEKDGWWHVERDVALRP